MGHFGSDEQRRAQTRRLLNVTEPETFAEQPLPGLEPAQPPQGRQGMLFDEDLVALDENIGYRGPVACKAAGITYRQLDYWARTKLVEPTVRGAKGSGTSGCTPSGTCWC